MRKGWEKFTLSQLRTIQPCGVGTLWLNHSYSLNSNKKFSSNNDDIFISSKFNHKSIVILIFSPQFKLKVIVRHHFNSNHYIPCYMFPLTLLWPILFSKRHVIFSVIQVVLKELFHLLTNSTCKAHFQKHLRSQINMNGRYFLETLKDTRGDTFWLWNCLMLAKKIIAWITMSKKCFFLSSPQNDGLNMHKSKEVKTSLFNGYMEN